MKAFLQGSLIGLCFKDFDFSDINSAGALFAATSAPYISVLYFVNCRFGTNGGIDIPEAGVGFYDCVFDNASILQNGEVFLAISSSLPMNTLIETFVSQSKIHTQSNIKRIVASQLKGLNIEPIPSIPSSLPHLSGYAYFKLDRKDPLFSSFAIIIRFSNEILVKASAAVHFSLD